eukprot:TRINITY_DN4232_c0_g1_i12.p1 TRINITY_DN4232_c0_g1~~TRINITY_DN4232_c0_g1_i12.p1  ORF type:complete len:342 (-),score=20.45 TRINITY_DN4232_c0_g1_i12:499-1524(-)
MQATGKRKRPRSAKPQEDYLQNNPSNSNNCSQESTISHKRVRRKCSDQNEIVVNNEVVANGKLKLNKRTMYNNSQIRQPIQIQVYQKLLAKAKSQISKIVQLLHLVETYQYRSWKNSKQSTELTKEIEQAKNQIAQCVEIIRGVLRYCDECEGDSKLDESLFSRKGEIFCEDIQCCRCETKTVASNYAADDVVLCDADDCRRAYHTKCINPQVDLQQLKDGEGWMCPSCDCKFDIMCSLWTTFDTSYEVNTPWYEVLPDISILVDDECHLSKQTQEESASDKLSNGKDGWYVNSEWRTIIRDDLPSEDEKHDIDYTADEKLDGVDSPLSNFSGMCVCRYVR